MKNQARFFTILLQAFAGLAAAVFIAFLNWLVVRGWFGGQGPANLGSIEVSYVSMGRFLVDYGWKSWAPFWYFGFPFHLFYTPLLPILEWLLFRFSGMPLWEGYRFITGWAYILAPVSLFLLGWALSRRWIGGFLSGVLYSVGPTIFYFVLPSVAYSTRGEVAGDRISASFWDPRRFVILVRWGEGPHLLSLVFMPLALAAFVLALRRKSFWWLVVAAIFLALAGLANALGLLGGLLLLGVMVFVRQAQRRRERSFTAMWAVLFVLLSLGLAGFWYNPSFLSNFFAEGEGAASRYLSLFPWGWLGAILTAGLLYVLVGKWLHDFGAGVALGWFGLVFSVVYVYYASAPFGFSQLRVELLPQALRYMTQVDMALAVLVGCGVAWVVKRVGGRFKVGEVVLTLFLGVLGLASLAYIQPYLDVSFAASSKSVDLSTSREKVISDWLETNVDSGKGERVFLPGNYGFYLNWFTDVWQHRGALFQAATHFWPEHIHYQMANGKDAQIALAWFKAMNAKYAVVTATGSAELYHEVKNFERFGDLPVAMEDRGDVVYEVPLLRPSLAKPVNVSEMEQLSVPSKADDKQALLAYAGWVERSSGNEAEFLMLDHDSYKIAGFLEEGEILLVQMSADAGWKASDEKTGKRIRVGRDPLGFLLLYPEILLGGGEVTITLKHVRVWQEWVGYGATLLTLAGVVGYGMKRRGEGRGERVEGD